MRDLAIVSSCSGYGIYLRDWAESIAALTQKPGHVALVIHGSKADEEHAPAVQGILDRAGIPCVIRCVPEKMDFGAARNLAVSLTSEPWVMHFDCDDTLLPHALEDIERLSVDADVVSLGYERGGDLKAGPSNLRRIYSSLNGLEALEATAPASGVSPFRRELWEKSPYRLGMLGAWDTALWIGFARMGARFRPTKRPAFIYRQHADSIFNRRRLIHDWTRAQVQNELAGLRHDYKGVDVVIPHRSDNGGPRDRSLQYVRDHYAAHHPEWRVIVGTDSGRGLWSKGDAVRHALTKATGAIVVIADGDCLVDRHALEWSVRAVERGEPWSIPHRLVHRLSEEATLRYMREHSPNEVLDQYGETEFQKPDMIRKAYEGYAGGGFIVVRRDRWEAIGGIPREFAGWGCEDEAVALVLNTLLGEAKRGTADLIHLWHPPGDRTKSPLYHANRRRLARYRAAEGSVEKMYEIIDPRRPVIGGSGVTVSGNRSRYSVPVKNSRQANAEPVIDTMSRTIEIRREQQARNVEQVRLNEVAAAAARERRLAEERDRKAKAGQKRVDRSDKGTPHEGAQAQGA